jgi:hypothetical protein
MSLQKLREVRESERDLGTSRAIISLALRVIYPCQLPFRKTARFSKQSLNENENLP